MRTVASRVLAVLATSTLAASTLAASTLAASTTAASTTAAQARVDFNRVDFNRVDFNRDIRPLLSDRCFKCHGFDAKARKANLRLDTWEGLTRKHEGRTPVVPHETGASELLRRIDSKDPGFVMPPKSSGLTLSATERALLRRWIEEGAPFAPHWAWVAPQRPAEPRVATPQWVRNPIDRFILARLEKGGLRPSPEADRETLIRRVTLDLTGLPPSLAEIDAFLADRTPHGYERLVDRLLASPRHGERMALMWLDAARYADTNGFHHDNIRTSWPYRDWVIRAFNDNMPFDQFATEQLAGDLLEEPTVAQRTATAFCRMHNINDEGGALDPEYRVEAVCDRIETVATTFLGLTFTCARCHDHKYDPFTQEDYFSLYAFFNSVDERGVYPNNFEQARAYPARLDFRPPDLDERLAKAEVELASARARLVAAAPSIAAERLAHEKALGTRLGLEWVPARLVATETRSGAELVPQPDGSARFAGKTPASDRHTFVLETGATGMRLLRFEALADPTHPKKSVGLARNGNAVVSWITAEAVSLRDPKRRQQVRLGWAWADHEQPNGDFDANNLLQQSSRGWALEGHNRPETRTALLLADAPFGFEGGTRVEVTVAYESEHQQHIVGRPRVTLAKAGTAVRDELPTVTSDWWQAGPFRAKDFDTAYATSYGPESVRRIARTRRFGRVGWKHRPKLTDGKPLALRGERTAFYFARTLQAPLARKLTVYAGSDDAIRVWLNREELLAKKVLRGVQPDQERIELQLAPGENLLVVKIVNNGGPGGFFCRLAPPAGAPGQLAPVALLDRCDEALRARYERAWGRERSPTFAALDGVVQKLEASVAKLEKESVPVLVMKELAKPRPAFVLSRGRYDLVDKDRPVDRRPPSLFAGLPEGAPKNRLGFARWLVAPDNPLTARVHVNRIWQMVFGTGIVESSENFGHQAALPSHLALLDWLATEFVRTGWDQKRLLRQVVTSATYRQSAVTNEAAKARDPANRLLGWFPRRRLSAEMIRDQALYVAGLLSPRVGGPSVRPYQPAGLWREVSIGGSSNTRIFERDTGEALYRRSLYTFWKRTSPSPQMAMFDAPTREFCVVRRSSTNTPLQALILWNDVQFLEAARVLAQRTLAAQGTREERLAAMWRRCTGRRPDARVKRILGRTLAGFLERYRASPADAAELLKQGDAPLPDRHDAATLAAWMMVASTLLAIDETVVRD